MQRRPRRSEPKNLALTEFLLLLATDERVSNAFRRSRKSARDVMNANGLTDRELQDVVLTGNSAWVMGFVTTEIRRARDGNRAGPAGGHEPPEITHALLVNLCQPPKK